MFRWMIVILVVLTGCAVGPDFKVPSAPTTKQYTKSPTPKQTVSAPVHAGEAQVIHYNKEIPASWWTLFHSQALNELIKQGLENNASLSAGQATLKQVNENLRAEMGSTLLPTLDSQFSGQRERTSLLASGIVLTPTGGGVPAFSLTNLFNLFNASVSFAYNLDIFGGTRRHLEALGAWVDYQEFELEATYLTLTSNIVTAAISMASLQAQLDTTNHVIDSQLKQLELTKNSFKLGHVSRLEVISKKEALKATQSKLPSLKTSLAKKQHALSVLIGKLPSESQIPHLKLTELHLPTELPVSLPAALVQQRPDIRSAEALLHKASAELGVATANLYPQFSITANYGYDSSILSSLFNPLNKIWNYGGLISLPLFHGGAYLAKRKAAIAAYDYAAAQYQKIVIEAFRNVADVLRALEQDAERLKINAESEFIAKSRLTLLKEQYRLGRVNYLAVLDANQTYENAKIKRIQAEATRFADTAALFQALGGGWWNR